MEEKIKLLMSLLIMKSRLLEMRFLEEISIGGFDKKIGKLDEEIREQTALIANNIETDTDGLYKKELEKGLKKYFLNLEKSSYNILYKKGMIDVHIYEKLLTSLDKQIENIDCDKPQFKNSRLSIENKIRKIKYAKVPSAISFLKLLFYRDEKNLIIDLYLYYVAKISGNKLVISEIKNFWESEAHLISECHFETLQTSYSELLTENTNRLDYIKKNYPEESKFVEEYIYNKELYSCMELVESEDSNSEFIRYHIK